MTELTRSVHENTDEAFRGGLFKRKQNSTGNLTGLVKPITDSRPFFARLTSYALTMSFVKIKRKPVASIIRFIMQIILWLKLFPISILDPEIPTPRKCKLLLCDVFVALLFNYS